MRENVSGIKSCENVTNITTVTCGKCEVLYTHSDSLLIDIMLLIMLVMLKYSHMHTCTHTHTHTHNADSTSRHLRNFLYFTASIVILFALCRLVLELAQIIVLRLNYVRDWINWMEVLLFVFSIIFVWVFNTECACTLIWQWQIGALSVFLAWITLIVFISKFPLVGLYVLMFVKIFYTFLKVVILSILLVIAFALTFYMAFNDPSNIKVSPDE